MLEFFLGYSMGERTASRSASLARSAAVADGTRHTNRIEDLDDGSFGHLDLDAEGNALISVIDADGVRVWKLEPA